MKMKEPETISSVLGQIKQEEKRTEGLKEDIEIQPDLIHIDMKFKNRKEKIVWLTDELRKEFEWAFDETASKWNKKRAKQ